MWDEGRFQPLAFSIFCVPSSWEKIHSRNPSSYSKIPHVINEVVRPMWRWGIFELYLGHWYEVFCMNPKLITASSRPLIRPIKVHSDRVLPNKSIPDFVLLMQLNEGSIYWKDSIPLIHVIRPRSLLITARLPVHIGCFIERLPRGNAPLVALFIMHVRGQKILFVHCIR